MCVYPHNFVKNFHLSNILMSQTPDIYDQGLKNVFSRCESLVEHINEKRKKMILAGQTLYQGSNAYSSRSAATLLRSAVGRDTAETFDFGQGLTMNRCKDAFDLIESPFVLQTRSRSSISPTATVRIDIVEISIDIEKKTSLVAIKHVPKHCFSGLH
jgi:hypothetical protein